MSEIQVNVSQDERIWMMGVNLSVFFGMVIRVLAPYSNWSIVPLYVLPLGALLVSLTRCPKDSLFRQHSKRALLFSVLFTLVYPVIAFSVLGYLIAEVGGQVAIVERMLALVDRGELGILSLTFGAAVAFDRTSSNFLAIDAGAYLLALVQLVLILQGVVYTLYNTGRAYLKKTAKYPLFLK